MKNYFNLTTLNASTLILIVFIVLAVFTALLIRMGWVGWLVRHLGQWIGASIVGGFRLWRRVFGWASWPLMLGINLTLLVVGEALHTLAPWVHIVAGGINVFAGVLTCLAYMFIDMERYEVGRGYKVIHNPSKGQELAEDFVCYGAWFSLPMLGVAAIGTIIGFAQLNYGLFETVGMGWYAIANGISSSTTFADFLAYAVIQLLRIVDVLDAINSQLVRLMYVRQSAWPAKLLVLVFQSFFTLLLLQQIFASLRLGKLRSETIADFWSPYAPIHDRARHALPQHGIGVIPLLFESLRRLPSITKEQYTQLPLVIASIGPPAIAPTLRYVNDTDEEIRLVAARVLGQVRAASALRELVKLRDDSSERVRMSVVEALDRIGRSEMSNESPARLAATRRGRWLFARAPSKVKDATAAEPDYSLELVLDTLRRGLTDASAAVRIQAAQALGSIGTRAASALPALIQLLQDSDETVRCKSAEALGKIGNHDERVSNALMGLLTEPNPALQIAAAQALGTFKQNSSKAVTLLIPLLRHQEPALRQTAAESIRDIGMLDDEALQLLEAGLRDEDSSARVSLAEAIGIIGTAAQELTPSLIDALQDENDRVRALAAQALGKIGANAADLVVPALVRSLQDADARVAALAALALAELGDLAEEAVPSLIDALQHVNPQVRANAAQALGNMGESAASAHIALMGASQDAEGVVRSQAIVALGASQQRGAETDQALLAALEDVDPQVRAAAIEVLNHHAEPHPQLAAVLPRLFEDPNDQVKYQAIRVLPSVVGAQPWVIEVLCRRLLEDDNAWIREVAALALGRLGPNAIEAGPQLLRAAQTAEVLVRAQALRSLALIQPPEALEAFAQALNDGEPKVRRAASGGWLRLDETPEESLPMLIDALRDPDAKVRMNVVRILARYEHLPEGAVPLLLQCAADPWAILRFSTVAALIKIPTSATVEALEQLLEDPVPRVRQAAATALLTIQPDHAKAVIIATTRIAKNERSARDGCVRD